MPQTYYDSELTGEQIETALNAIDNVVTPSNNGKVLAIMGNQIVAKSASDYTDAPVLEYLAATENGDYYPPEGADGFNAVSVNVSASSALHISISSFSSFPQTVNNASITSDMRIVNCVWGTPSAITSDVTWTTANGSLSLSGNISGSTTAEIDLISF